MKQPNENEVRYIAMEDFQESQERSVAAMKLNVCLDTMNADQNRVVFCWQADRLYATAYT